MVISLVLVLLVTASGTITTYLYDDRAHFASRICAGACVGLTAFGLIGFIIASFIELTPLAIALTALVAALPFVLVRDVELRKTLRQDLAAASQNFKRGLLHPSARATGYFLFYVVTAVVLWQVYDRAMFELPEGIYTGLLNNFGDLPFHLSVITSFAYGNNFPPEDPTYAGVRFTYPFLSDFISAVFVRCGANLQQSMFIENWVLGVSLVGLLHRWAWELLKDRLAAVITPLLVILNGGFGWILIWINARQNNLGLLESLSAMPPSITVIPETAWRWGNAVSTLLVPQRGMLIGLPLAVIVFTQWWMSAVDDSGTPRHGTAENKKDREKGRKGEGESRKKDGEKGRRGDAQIRKSTSPRPRVPASPRLPILPIHTMIAAGIIAGLLPLVHAHSFVVVIVVGACLALGWHARAWILVVSTLLLYTALFIVSFPLVMAAALKVLFVLAVALAIALWFVLPTKHRNLWYAFFISAVVIAGPQMWWSTHASAVDSSSFFAFEFGWDSGKEKAFEFTLASDFLRTSPHLRLVLERFPDVAWFWFKNTGLFIPLILVAIFWRGTKSIIHRRLLYFYLPFTLCFIIPNFVKLAPWVWDNIKVLYYWWLASAPLVAVLLARLWREGWAPRVLALGLFICVILAGSLDVGSILFKESKYQIFDRAGIQFAEVVKQQTSPRELIIHAPVHNHPIFLTGRRSLMGYPGHVWTHGLDFVQREAEIKRFYAGFPDALELQRKYGISKAVVSPLERNFANVNDQFFSSFPTIGAVGEYQLYQIAP